MSPFDELIRDELHDAAESTGPIGFDVDGLARRIARRRLVRQTGLAGGAAAVVAIVAITTSLGSRPVSAPSVTVATAPADATIPAIVGGMDIRLTAAANEVEKIGQVQFKDVFTGVGPGDGRTLVIWRKPSEVFDTVVHKEMRERFPEIAVRMEDSVRTAAELAVFADRIRSDESHWQAEGLRILGIGQDPLGRAVFVTVEGDGDPTAAFTERYGEDFMILVQVSSHPG